jgi:ankyrin repeat protein
VNKSLSTPDGESACMRAAMFRHTDIVGYLLNNGVDMYVRDRNRRTLAHYAVRGKVAPPVRGDTSVATDDVAMKQQSDELGKVLLELLVKFKCNLWAQDNQHRTPLHYAAAQGHLRITDYLVKHAPSVSMLHGQNSSRKTPVDVAREHNQISMVYFLEGKMVRLLLVRGSADVRLSICCR